MNLSTTTDFIFYLCQKLVIEQFSICWNAIKIVEAEVKSDEEESKMPRKHIYLKTVIQILFFIKGKSLNTNRIVSKC